MAVLAFASFPEADDSVAGMSGSGRVLLGLEKTVKKVLKKVADDSDDDDDDDDDVGKHFGCSAKCKRHDCCKCFGKFEFSLQGESCTKDGIKGVCKDKYTCKIKRKRRPEDTCEDTGGYGTQIECDDASYGGDRPGR